MNEEIKNPGRPKGRSEYSIRKDLMHAEHQISQLKEREAVLNEKLLSVEQKLAKWQGVVAELTTALEVVPVVAEVQDEAA